MFETPKPVGIVEYVLQQATDSDSIVLDSFVGSETTAHAVLNMNKFDNGNWKFILIEMEDYADSITAERVKCVIDGYGDDRKTVIQNTIIAAGSVKPIFAQCRTFIPRRLSGSCHPTLF